MSALCNGIKLKACNADCNRIAVKSTHQSSWNMTFKKWSFLSAEVYDVAIAKNELLVVAFQDGSGQADIEVIPLGDKAGTLLMQSSRNAHQTLRVGGKYRYSLKPGESVTFRCATMVHPTRSAPAVAV